MLLVFLGVLLPLRNFDCFGIVWPLLCFGRFDWKRMLWFSVIGLMMKRGCGISYVMYLLFRLRFHLLLRGFHHFLLVEIGKLSVTCNFGLLYIFFGVFLVPHFRMYFFLNMLVKFAGCWHIFTDFFSIIYFFLIKQTHRF